MCQRNLDLIVSTVIAALNIGWAFLPVHSSVVGGFLVAPLVFVVPGYTLTSILFYRTALGPSYRFIISLVLNLVIDIAGGFLLNLFSLGLQALSWSVFLSSLTIVFSLVAALLRQGSSLYREQGPKLHVAVYEGLLFVLAIIVVIFSIAYATFGVAQQPYPGFTQFWMLSANQAGKDCSVRLGIHSFEQTPVTYRVTMTVMGGHATEWSSITLSPQQEWNQVVPVISEVTTNVSIDAKLYRVDKAQTVYRNVHIALPRCAL